MFPNLRLTVVAILAAITGIGCGLGLFATFRVNHEPLARLAEGSPPLQLAFDRLGLNSQPQMPLEARLPLNSAAKVISVPGIQTPSAADVGAGATVSAEPGDVQASAGAAPEIDQSDLASVPAVTPAVPAAQSIAMHEDSAAAPNQLDTVTAAGDQQLSAPPSAPATSSSAASDAQQIAAVNAAAPDEQPSTPPSAPAASAPATPSAEQTVNAAVADEQPTAAPSAPAASPPAVPSAEQTDHEPAAKAAVSAEKKAAKPTASAVRPAPVRRVTRIVRARRTVARVASRPASQYSQTTYAQPTYTQSTYAQPTYTQPSYSWADGTKQAAVKRVQIKRHRAAKKMPPAAQSNPLPATAGLSNGQ